MQPQPQPPSQPPSLPLNLGQMGNADVADLQAKLKQVEIRITEMCNRQMEAAQAVCTEEAKQYNIMLAQQIAVYKMGREFVMKVIQAKKFLASGQAQGSSQPHDSAPNSNTKPQPTPAVSATHQSTPSTDSRSAPQIATPWKPGIPMTPNTTSTTYSSPMNVNFKPRASTGCLNCTCSTTLKEDFIVCKSLEWYKSFPNNHPYDVHIIAYTLLFRIVNKFHQEVFSDPTVPNSLNRLIDFWAVMLEHDWLLTNCHQEWAEHFERDLDHSNAACEFHVKPLLFYTNYTRLVMFSFRFQNAFQRGLEADDEVFFTRVRDFTPSCIVGMTLVFFKSLESAKTVITVLVDSLVPTGYIQFALDGYFVFVPFASAFMLKFITPGLETEVYKVIEPLIATIGSPQIAIDERHTPKLYSRFLESLLVKHKRDGTAQGRMPQQGPPPQQM
ncbi:hypothetical protein F5148DRAFT_1148956 [Russula earlei]|uniref:Uncharacterized protein n=1 Tax=Russula earlei TaxID=71964 RepID=A0ACC0UA08_9AGAM|nr:hypothetical protein F5148DRAFT_1148956 [Russula earlei]